MQAPAPAVLFKDHGTRCTTLAAFFDNPQFSDITVIVPSGRALRCHQVVLGGVSSRLQNLLAPGAYTNQDLPLAGADAEALVSVLKFMYTGEVALTASTVIPLYDAANKLEVTCLCTAALQYLNSVMQPATMTIYMEQALTFGQGPLVDTVMSFYEQRHTEILNNPSFPTLSEASLAQLIGYMATRQPLQQLIDIANAWCNGDPMRLATAQQILNPHLPGPVAPTITPPPQGEFVVLTPQNTESCGAQPTTATSTNTLQQAKSSQPINGMLSNNTNTTNNANNNNTTNNNNNNTNNNAPMQIAVPPAQTNNNNNASTSHNVSLPGHLSVHSKGQAWNVQMPGGQLVTPPPGPPSGTSFQLMSNGTNISLGPHGQLVHAPPAQIPVPPMDPPPGIMGSLIPRHPGNLLKPITTMSSTNQPTMALTANPHHLQPHGTLVGSPQGAMLQANGGMDANLFRHQSEDDSGNAAHQSGGGTPPQHIGSGYWSGLPVGNGGGSVGRDGSMDGEPEALHHHLKMQLVPGTVAEGMPMGGDGRRQSGGTGGYRYSGRSEGREGRGTSTVPRGMCSIENCFADLSQLREYHQRFRICDYHLKIHSIMRDGILQRFCQQCGRFHDLTEFDGNKRSCRARLQKHNARRRKRGDLIQEDILSIPDVTPVGGLAAPIPGVPSPGAPSPGHRWSQPGLLAAAITTNRHNNNAPQSFSGSPFPPWSENYDQEDPDQKRPRHAAPRSTSPDSGAAASTSEATLGSTHIVAHDNTDNKGAAGNTVDVPPPQPMTSHKMAIMDVGPVTPIPAEGQVQ